MKLFNLKKVAVASAFVAGNIIAVNVNAQSLVTSFPTILAGSVSGTTLTANGSGGLGAYSNSFAVTSGASYTLTYSLTGTVPNGGISFTSNNGPGGTRVTVAGGNGIGLTAGSSNVVNISAASISALAGGSAYLYTFSGTGGSASYILDILSLLAGGSSSGPSAANTNTSLQNTAAALQSIYTLQNAVLANSFAYDCNVFGANNVCVSAGGRNTAVSAADGLNNTSALLIAGYRINPQYRIGAYADQNVSVNNAGSGVVLGNNTPLIGIFGAWNERTDDLGAEVKVSAAYGQKNTTITRGVVGTGSTASEAGSGGSQLNSQGAQVTAKYGFGVADATVVSPYAGVRYTQNNMGGYTEATSSAVTAPLTYSALNTNATTVLAGAIASYKGIPKTTLFASAGVESDTNTSNGTMSATNSSIGALTPVNFNSNPVKTRPTASVGAYYDVEKNQRLGVTGIYRQEAYQATQTTTVMATYTIGL